MAGARRWRIVGLLALLAGMASPVAADQPRLVIHLDDRAGVLPRELAAARTVVERTFRTAGVEVAWIDGRFPVSLQRRQGEFREAHHLALMLVNSDEPSTRGAKGCTLGFAAPRQSVAYAFYNRIVHATERQPADLTLVLGRVIAHEIGHLLLPPNSHARFGIMRADLDLGMSNPDGFTKEQAQAIRAQVAAGASRQ